MSLDDCFRAAVQMNETVKIQDENIVQADENYVQAKGAILPQVTGSASDFWQQNPAAQGATASSFYPPSQPLVKVSGDQPLFRGFREYAGLRQTKDLVRSQEETWKNTAIALFRDTSLQFYTVASLEQDMRNLGTEIDLNLQWIDELEKRIRIGRSQLTEKLVEEVNVYSLRAQMESLDEQLKVARENLALDTGLSTDIPINDTIQLPDTIASEGDYIALIQKRPDVASSVEAQASAQEGTSIAWGAHLPSIDLLGDYYFDRTGALQNVDWDIQIALTVPIFAGGTIQSKVRQAASQERQADLTRARTERAAAQDVRTWYKSFLSDLQQMRAYEKAAVTGKKNYLAQMQQYRMGLVTNIDVLTALTAYQENVRALDRAKFSSKLDYTRLESSVAHMPAGSDLVPPH
jgi:outer membrane protein